MREKKSNFNCKLQSGHTEVAEAIQQNKVNKIILRL